MRTMTTLFLCALLLAPSGTGHAQEYYGIPIPDGGAAFLLDISGSMENKDEAMGSVAGSAIDRLAQRARQSGVGRTKIGGILIDRAVSETTKMGAARRALMRALGSLRDGTRFTVITFGNVAQEWPGGIRVA